MTTQTHIVVAVTFTAVFTIFAESSTWRTVTIDNNAPKLDVHGQIVDAHDGTYRYYEGYWWYHGAEYGLCKEPPNEGCDPTPDHCGFRPDHNVSIWRSPDLSSGSWEFIGRAGQCSELPNCLIMYRPHVVFNPNTGLYVLFVNYVSSVSYAGYAVYTAPSPAGPFDLVNQQMNITRLCPGPSATPPCGVAQGGAGDFDVFVDDDGAGYLIYSANFYMSIERLTSDFIYSTGQNSSCGGDFNGTVFAEYFVEAPAIFKRGATYYALFGTCCCFCSHGTGILVHTAPHPSGPWVRQAGPDLACKPDFTSVVGHSFGGNRQGCPINQTSVVRSQQNFIIEVPAHATDLSQYIWTGDRWQQAPDRIKGHEGQYWTPLTFVDNGTILPVEWLDTVTFQVPVAASNHEE